MCVLKSAKLGGQWAARRGKRGCRFGPQSNATIPGNSVSPEGATNDLQPHCSGMQATTAEQRTPQGAPQPATNHRPERVRTLTLDQHRNPWEGRRGSLW